MERSRRLLLVAGLLAALLPAAAAAFGPQPGAPCKPTLLATQVALFCAPDMPTAQCCEPVVAAVDLGVDYRRRLSSPSTSSSSSHVHAFLFCFETIIVEIDSCSIPLVMTLCFEPQRGFAFCGIFCLVFVLCSTVKSKNSCCSIDRGLSWPSFSLCGASPLPLLPNISMLILWQRCFFACGLRSLPQIKWIAYWHCFFSGCARRHLLLLFPVLFTFDEVRMNRLVINFGCCGFWTQDPLARPPSSAAQHPRHSRLLLAACSHVISLPIHVIPSCSPDR
ncbi:uncharacterized protein LOC119294644 [Triticum dicoccoides]|uniref:uncharacterized protein LOC119294644 n=1 Tax=Triticum dicoccoides TaxID=85692 RepID=UPI00188EA59E|nr:uncharacterized protein LOC119294644 [Triticum dicoccoides]